MSEPVREEFIASAARMQSRRGFGRLRTFAHQGATRHSRWRAALLALCGMTLIAACLPAPAAVHPTGQSFESFTNDHPISLESDWSASAPEHGLVSTNLAIINALTNYPVGGKSFPLTNAAHARVLKIEDVDPLFDASVINTLTTAADKIVVLDFMVFPSIRVEEPTATSTQQIGFYINTNSQAVIWHQNRSGGSTNNEWRILTNSPSISTTAWHRVSMGIDYSNGLYQVRIDEDDPIVDGNGWTATGGTQPGPWFYMPQTNGSMSRVRFDGESTYYADDLVLTNRSLSYSAATFSEVAANDGAIDNSSPPTITLQFGKFASTNNADFVGEGRVSVANLPAGLTAVITRASDTTLSVTLTGNASPHTDSDGVANLTFTFNDNAFELGQANGVDGGITSDLIVDLDDAPVLALNKTSFSESAANDGTIDNSSPITISLTGDTLVGAVGTDFVAAGKIAVSNVPSGLFAVVTNTTSSNLVAILTNAASSHATADTINNLEFHFQDSAFAIVAAANIDNAVTTNLAVNFSDGPALSYGTTTFTEKDSNDGSVNGTIISLAAKAFTGVNGDDFVADGDVVAANVPPGLVAVMTRDGDQQLTLTLTNTATSHANANDISSLTFTFQDSAFVGGNAAGVSNSSLNDLVVDFNDQPTLAFTGGSFNENDNNDGSIGNTLTITLTSTTGESLTGGNGSDFVVAGKVNVVNVPAGLTAVLTKNSSSNATVSLTGDATSHANANDISNLTFTFQNNAFTLADADQVANYTRTNVTVNFNDQPVITYSRSVFDELHEGTIDNTTPMTLTLSSTTAETFAGSNGDEFVGLGRISVANVPAGLTAVIERTGSMKLNATLTGTATSHTNANDVSDLTFAFNNSAITLANADEVVNYNRTDLQVDFDDSTLFINTVAYSESFETYDNGLRISGTNGWQGNSATAGIVTNIAELVNALTNYPVGGKSFPLVDTNHTQILCVGLTAADALDEVELTDEVKGGDKQNLFIDTMLYPTVRQLDPTGTTNHQFGLFVNTNFLLRIWHNDQSGVPANVWQTLTNSPAISTSAWSRVTIEQDYTNSMFQVRINEAEPLTDSTGWTAGGGSQPGSWFFMVKTNQVMSRIRFVSGQTVYTDDLVVSPDQPNFLIDVLPDGTMYIIK